MFGWDTRDTGAESALGLRGRMFDKARAAVIRPLGPFYVYPDEGSRVRVWVPAAAALEACAAIAGELYRRVAAVRSGADPFSGLWLRSTTVLEAASSGRAVLEVVR
ncbi:MAG: hypothetical protein EPO06_11755 [Burkholderiaceae bacterium]|nr:MAG: hypothetical protein EPO06_11755 [Burkholderiaceae bacterium]